MRDYRTYQLNRRERLGSMGCLAMGLLAVSWLVYNTWVGILLLPLFFRPVERRVSQWLCDRRQ